MFVIKEAKLCQLTCCLFTVVCPYLVWMGVLSLYLGTLMVNSRMVDDPPYYLMPRMLFMMSVAILVERRGGRPSCLRTAKSVFFEIILSICMCNLALKLVWEQVEKITFTILKSIAYLVEAVFGVSIACETCKGVHDLQFLITILLSSLLLVWVLYSVVTKPFIYKNACQGLFHQNSSVRFWSTVAVRFVNPVNYSSEAQTSTPLVAPQGGPHNPVVSSPGLMNMKFRDTDVGGLIE